MKENKIGTSVILGLFQYIALFLDLLNFYFLTSYQTKNINLELRTYT